MDDTLRRVFALDGRVAIITGGGGMLGMEYAATLGGAGARVALFDVLPKERLDECAARLQSRGIEICPVSVDITDRGAVEAAVTRVRDRWRRIDILINNAALNPTPGSAESEQQFAPYERYSTSLWQRELDVILTGSLNLAQTAGDTMMAARGGVMLNIATDLAVIAPDNRIYEPGRFKSIGYVTGKGGLLSMTRALASYFAPFNIRVNALTPGGVHAGQDDAFVSRVSRLVMLGRMARRDEFNAAVLFLCSDASSYMTGANLVVDGGRTTW